MKEYIGIMILLAGWALTSCDGGTSSSEVSGIQGSWQLQSFMLDDGTNVSIPNPENYTARFTAEGTVNALADCNNCNSSYETTSGSITIGMLACTRAYCGDASLDAQYTAALSSASSFSRGGDVLLLTYNGGTMRFLTAQ